MTKLIDEKVKEIEVEFFRKEIICQATAESYWEHEIHSPMDINDEDHMHQLTIEDICHIAAIWHPNINFSEDSISTEEVNLAIQAISSSAITDEERGIGHFICHELCQLTTWPLWKTGKKPTESIS